MRHIIVLALVSLVVVNAVPTKRDEQTKVNARDFMSHKIDPSAIKSLMAQMKKHSKETGGKIDKAMLRQMLTNEMRMPRRRRATADDEKVIKKVEEKISHQKERSKLSKNFNKYEYLNSPRSFSASSKLRNLEEIKDLKMSRVPKHIQLPEKFQNKMKL
jgi:hypothetical protein